MKGLGRAKQSRAAKGIVVTPPEQQYGLFHIPGGRTQIWSTIRNPLRDIWLTITYPLRDIWSPLIFHAGQIRHTTPMGLRAFIQHLILCLTMTILLPISSLWKFYKLVFKGRSTLTWEMVLVISCLGMLIDPLFFYIPFINEENKCIGMNKKMRITVLALRSLIDFVLILHIVAQIHDRIDIPSLSKQEIDIPSDSKGYNLQKVARRIKWLSRTIIIDFFSVLPIPQVTVAMFFYRMTDSGYLYKTLIGNFFLLLQFIVRGCQIYHFEKQFTMLGKWTKTAFYFILYAFVGHVLGAFWYFFSIQREISCWHHACTKIPTCTATNYCEDIDSSTNVRLLNELCPLNPSNATIFDFGVFLEALESGNTGPISFSTKYFYTLWWGIRNLSNFGSDLEASSYMWENFFVILISLVGLLLFLFLMGNVQTYILWESTKALETREEKLKTKYEALDIWMLQNGISQEIKTHVVRIIKQQKAVERNYVAGLDIDVDVKFVFNALIADENKRIIDDLKIHFCKNVLKKVPFLQNLTGSLHVTKDLILQLVQPVIYDKNSYVVRGGEQHEKLLIIIEGVIVCTENSNTSDASTMSSSSLVYAKSRFEKGELYGEELLNIVVNCPAPVSIRDVKCQTKVEAFAITVDELKSIARSLRRNDRTRGLLHECNYTDPTQVNKAYKDLTTTRTERLLQKATKMDQKEKDIIEWLSRSVIPNYLQRLVMKHIKTKNVLEKNLDAEVDVKYLFSIDLPWDVEYEIKKCICLGTLRKVPVLQEVDTNLLNLICMHLEPVILAKNTCIVNTGDLLGRMLIIVEGEITATKWTGTDERTRKLKKGDFFGEKVLSWAFPKSNFLPAISKEYVDCTAKLEAFVLTKEGLESVVSYYNHGIDKLEKLDNGGNSVANTSLISGASITTSIEQKLHQIIQLLADQGQRLDDQGRKLDDQGRKLDEINVILTRRGYSGTPPPPSPPPPPPLHHEEQI